MNFGKILILLSLALLFVALVYLSQSNHKIIIQPQKDKTDAKNISYVLEGKLVKLENGQSEITLENSEAKIVTKFLSSTEIGDINDDGFDDLAIWLSQETGGSGTFYYVALALAYEDGYYGTNGVFIGDRIDISDIENRSGMLRINYLGREFNQSISDEPSVAMTKFLTWEEDTLKELNFSHELIKLDDIKAGDYISSPLVISGEARGYWFFEASFPVMLVDWDGLIISEGIATAKSDWMTEDFVPFTVTLDFTKPTISNRGALIFKKDNPSGLPEYDDAFEIPIFFQ